MNKHVSGKGILDTLEHLPGTLLNKAINSLPVELHIPGYNFCGPGTKLSKRLARGDKGINPLDNACLKHDIAYSSSNDNSTRAKADTELANKAFDRLTASDSSLSEKASALAITGLMKLKSKFGGKLKRKKGKGLYVKPYPKTGKGLYVKPWPKNTGSGLKKKKNVKKKRKQKK